jgi:hypothetical protein
VREFEEYKRYVESQLGKKDHRFEIEVRAILSEQMTYISELQDQIEKKVKSSAKEETPRAVEKPSQELRRCKNWIAFTSETIAEYLKA